LRCKKSKILANCLSNKLEQVARSLNLVLWQPLDQVAAFHTRAFKFLGGGQELFLCGKSAACLLRRDFLYFLY